MNLTDLRYGAKLDRFHPVIRYLFGLSLFALSLSSRFALVDILPRQGFPFLTFFPAVLLTALLAGIGPGLLVSALSILSAWYFFIPPFGTFAGISTADLIALVFFVCVLLVDCIVIHLMNVSMHALQRSREHVRHAAQHDPLTGLPNRALIFEYGKHLLAAGRRQHSRGALLFVDLDRFKPINDLHGHEAGDVVLKEVSKRLAACTREEDLVGRLGGDEFVVILPQLDTNRDRAAAVAQHVIDALRRPIRIKQDLELSVSPSIGISFFPDYASDMNTLIHTADTAMYEAKRAGRAGYQFYTPELEERTQQSLQIQARLQKALQYGGLRLHYQPVVDVTTGKLIGAEALVRLVDGDDAKLTPDQFIPVAEACGLIMELGDWVAVEACRQHKTWLAEGLELTLSINVSPIQLRQHRFADKLNSILENAGMDPGQLEIEVTESAVMENIEDAIKILQDIKSLGVKVALDDFGIGYSSLASLTSLPLDKLKVDQSFMRRVEQDPACRNVAAAIIALGRSLKLNVHGEGIESEASLRYLQEHGCNVAQGYWFSEPLPPSEFAMWCREKQQLRSLVDSGGAR